MTAGGKTLRLLISGGRGGTHVGDSFLAAAGELGVEARLADLAVAMAGPWAWRAVSWRLLGHRPPGLCAYDRLVRAEIADFRPHLLLTTGNSPVPAATLALARAAGIMTANFSTDDPWNPLHLSHRFLRSVPEYDLILTPREANCADFRSAGARRIERLSFAYDPRYTGSGVYNPVAGGTDVLFVGGADPDRVALLDPLLLSGLRLALYGGRWERYTAFARAARGMLPPPELAGTTAAAKVSLCLVRRANRDGHVMRSFEIAASGGCVLAEDTPDHRDIFADTAVYFITGAELAERAAELVADPVRRANLAAAARRRVTSGGNSYRDRLATILAAFSHQEVK